MLQERQTERAEAGFALREGLSGDGSLIVITGPPGTGKSALVREIGEAGAALGARVLRADGTRAEQDYAFGVVHQLFQPLVAGASEGERSHWFAGAAETVRPLVTEVPGDGEAGPGWLPAETLLRGLSALTARVAAEGMTLLVVDDLQWADTASLRWLGYLAKRLDGSRLVIVGTICDTGVPTDAALLQEVLSAARRTLQPAPLSVAGVRAIAAEEFGEDCDLEFARACHEVSAGVPAALLPVLRGLHVQNVRPTATYAPEVAWRSQPLLCERRLFLLGTQPGVAQDLAQAIAVLGDHAEEDLVGALAGLDRVTCKSALQALDRAGLLAPAPGLRFVHESVAVAVEAAMTMSERTDMHRRAAAQLHEAGQPAEQVADQLLQVILGHDSWEIDVLRTAASNALERGAGRTAARYLRRALLDSADESTDRARLLVDLACAERGFDLSSSVRHITQALRQVESPAERAATVLWLPPGLASTEPSVARLVTEIATTVDAGTHPDLAWRLEARSRYVGLQDPDRLADAVRRLGELTGAPQPPAASPAGRELLAVLLFAATVSAAGHADETAGLAESVLRSEPPTPDHGYTALPLLVSTLVAADAPGAATPWLRTALDKAREQESPALRALLAAEWSAVRCAQGQLGAARSLALAALADADRTWPDTVAFATSALADVALRTQDVELARRVLTTGHETDDLQVTMAHRMMRGLVDLSRGRTAQALDRFLDCGALLERSGWTNPALCPWRLWAATAYERLGDMAAAVALAEREYAAAQEWHAPSVSGRAMARLAVLTGGDEGTELSRLAVARLAESADRVEYARAAATLGTRLGARSPEGADLRTRAGRIAAECGVVWAKSDFTDEGHGPVPRLAATQQATLSKAERLVADLVVLGWTNQRIADSLGVTRRAVEKHLTGIYRKFGVSGRAALVAHLENEREP